MGGRNPHEAERCTGDDAEGALRAHHEADEVVSRAVLDGTAERDELARRQRQLDAEHVVGRDAVLERVRPAGVLGDVAADRAGGLARGVRRVAEAVRPHGVRHPLVHDPGLGNDPVVPDVDRLDATQPARADHHRRADGQRAARETRASAARDK